MSKSRKLNKGKKLGIIAGCAAAAEAALGVAALVATPLTGGISGPIGVALLSSSAKTALIAGGTAVAGAGAGVVVTKVVDNKKAEKAYEKGCNDTSKTYEAKFTEQAQKFAEKEGSWAKTEQSWEKTQAKKDELLQDCLKYITDLEKERDSLKAENRTLSQEKQELLEKLYGIRKKLTVD